MSDTRTEMLRQNTQDMQSPLSDLPVGEILRRVRLQFKLSQDEVEQSLRIRAIYIDAIEKGEYAKIPGQIYVLGFVKAYAEFLGLDSGQITQMLKLQSGHKVERPANVFPVADDEQKVPSKKVILISTAALIFTLIVWRMSGPSYKSDVVPAVPRQLAQLLTAPQKPKPAPVATASAVVEAPKPHPLVLKAVQDVWLEIRDDKAQPIFSRVLKTGEEYWVPIEAKDYRMTTGNAGGLEIVIEGKTYPTLGKVGEVKRKISLNPEDMKLLLPSPTQIPEQTH